MSRGGAGAMSRRPQAAAGRGLGAVLVASALLAAAALPSPAAALKLPPSREVRLPSGALLILAERHDVPLIAFHAILRGGALADPSLLVSPPTVSSRMDVKVTGLRLVPNTRRALLLPLTDKDRLRLNLTMTPGVTVSVVS